MNEVELTHQIEKHLVTLCDECGNRHVGSPGNRQATAYAERILTSFGFEVRTDPFECMEWESGDVILEAGGCMWPATVGPYSLAFDGRAALVAVSSLEELERTLITDRVVLLHGELVREQIMPKNFVFYNPDDHRKLISLLEDGRPAALVCATGKNPGTAGSVYPFPLFEDGDLDIPSVTMKDVDGDQLLKYVGSVVELAFESSRVPSTGTNVIGGKGRSGIPNIVLCAHIDAKKDTPGALDNATGVATLLGLAELLADYNARTRIEIIFFNGEDYYAVPGQMQYLAQLGEGIREINLVINLDAAGHRDAPIAYSFYGCSDEVRQAAEAVFSTDPVFAAGDAWVQSDHTMFVMAGCPAIALTSGNFDWLCKEITHTPLDAPELVDCGKLVTTTYALRDIVARFEDHLIVSS